MLNLCRLFDYWHGGLLVTFRVETLDMPLSMVRMLTLIIIVCICLLLFHRDIPSLTLAFNVNNVHNFRIDGLVIHCVSPVVKRSFRPMTPIVTHLSRLTLIQGLFLCLFLNTISRISLMLSLIEESSLLLSLWLPLCINGYSLSTFVETFICESIAVFLMLAFFLEYIQVSHFHVCHLSGGTYWLFIVGSIDIIALVFRFRVMLQGT